MNDSFYVQGQKPAEDKRLKNGVPYTSVADANATIPKKDRYMTLEVGIRIAGVTFIYWWKDGLEDYNLVLKEDGSGSGNLPSVLIFKDVVPTVADLDTISNPETGWVYGVESDGALYVYIKDYNGQIGNNIWKNLGVAVDLRDYVKNSDLTTALNGYAKKDGSNLTLPAFRDNLNIQVSATNLAKNSKRFIDSNSYLIRDVEVSKVLESGKTYTVKVWTRANNQNTNAYFSIGDQTGHLVNLTKISPTEFVGKIVMPRDSNGSLVLSRQPDDSSWYQFEAIKIVEGDMITKDWSPSPDDAPVISFATEGEVENNTPPASENSKAVSLFGLWKWWAKRKIEVLLKNFTEATTLATNGYPFSITGLTDKSADSTYNKALVQNNAGDTAWSTNVQLRNSLIDVVVINSNTELSEVHHNKLLSITANCVLTIPLNKRINALVSCKDTVYADITNSDGVTVYYPQGTRVIQGASASILSIGTNNYEVRGGLIRP